MIKMSLGGRLRMLRTENSLTQDEFRELFELKTGKHLSIAGYSNYENDKRFPDKKTLNLFCDFYDVTMDFIMGRTDNRKGTSAASLVPDGFEFKSMDDILMILYLKLVADGKLKAGDPLPEVAVRIIMDKLAAGSDIVESFKETGGKSNK